MRHVNTVLGSIAADDLGRTYIHEHLYVKPSELPKHYPYTLDNVDKSIEEASLFREAGGCSIVDLSPLNFGRNAEVLADIARASSVNVLCVTGFHKQEHLPTWFYELGDNQLYDVLSDEIEDGIGYSHIKPCAIKVGSSLGCITDAEKRAIKICGAIARDYGLPVITHCDKGTMGVEQIDLLVRSGVSPDAICLSHVDLTLDIEYLKRLCGMGAFISFDHVGRDLHDGDAHRIELLKELVEAGCGDKVCLAGDMGKKDYFKSYDGRPGLDYILTDFRKAALECISEAAFERMLVDNPKRVLSGC